MKISQPQWKSHRQIYKISVEFYCFLFLSWHITRVLCMFDNLKQWSHLLLLALS
jgi:hypothetical protein